MISFLRSKIKVGRNSLLLLLLLLPLTTLASDFSNRTLVFEMIDGQRINYVLEEEPRISFSGKEGVVSTKGQTNARFLFSNIRKYYFVNTSTGIENLKRNEMFVSMNNGNITISNAPANSEISVYKADGCVVDRLRVGVDGKASLSLDEYASGVYVIKTGSFSYKFAK